MVALAGLLQKKNQAGEVGAVVLESAYAALDESFALGRGGVSLMA